MTYYTTDNYLSGDKVLDTLGEEVYADFMKSRRAHPLCGVTNEYWFKHEIYAMNQLKSAFWVQPIVAVKRVPKYDLSGSNRYENFHASFNKKSAYYISTVNSPNSLNLNSRSNQRGNR